MNLSVGEQWSRRPREQAYGHDVGRRGWDALRESHGNVHTLPYIKLDGQWKFAV